jgi:integrase
VEAHWLLALRRLQAAGSPWRLWRRRDSPHLWVRRMEVGMTVERFSLAPLRCDRSEDITAAAELCLLAVKQKGWPQPRPQQRSSGGSSWQALAEQVSAEVIKAIPKQGSRVHLLNDLRLRIAQLRGVPSAQALGEWARQVNPLEQRRSYNRRLEVLSWIDRVAPELALPPVLAELRNRRPRGAAVRLAAAQGLRVRLVPSDSAIEAWLDGLDGFNQWVFAVAATYGIRPHELWHIEGVDARGWVTIPGEMRTKSARAHFAPPVPGRWLLRYRLAEQWPWRRGQLLERWPIRWEQRGGVMIPVNNAELGQYLRKQFTLRGVQRLVAPVAEGEGVDWLRPYDLRHSYAIRCATSAETAGVDPEQQAAWLGHSWEVHQRIYLRWLPPGRMRRHQQQQFDAARRDVLADGERQELEQLRLRMAALQQLLGSGGSSD